MDKYFSVAQEAEVETVIERSRFIAYTKSTPTEDEARAFIDSIKKKHSLATHNCYAYVAERGMIKRSSDDGEPGGTAGVPILEAIIAQNLVDTAVVVTRYFGGIKLGAGGLVRAYSRCATEGLKSSGVLQNSLCSVFKLTVPYDKLTKVVSVLNKDERKIMSTDYGENVVLEFALYAENVEQMKRDLNETLATNVDPLFLENKYLSGV